MPNIKIYEADFESDYITPACNVVVIEANISGVFNIFRFYDAPKQIKVRAIRDEGGLITFFVQSTNNSLEFDTLGTYKFSEVSKRDESDKAGASLDEVLDYIDQVISSFCSY